MTFSVKATAPGKIILFGEHAVVYGQPAIAMPVAHLRATAEITPNPSLGGRVLLHAPDVGEDVWLDQAPAGHPLAAAVRIFAQNLPPAEQNLLSNLNITVHSQLPIASGLGSGAAISAALIRALAGLVNRPDYATPAQLSRLTYEVERLHHGTPSGIDNTVVSYEQPVFFQRLAGGEVKIEPFAPHTPFTILIGNTGIAAPTKESVGDVRRQWQVNPAAFEALFNECGWIARQARTALETGQIAHMGELMNQNQAVLEKMTVSSPELERLITAARSAGAWGAKLSGGGRGGNMIALVPEELVEQVKEGLWAAGATGVWQTVVQGQK